MNRLFLLLSLFFSTVSFSQKSNKIRKVVSILEETKHIINGGAKATFNGNSRIYHTITLPPNTVEWYYTITTNKSENNQNSPLNLIPQLTRFFDPTGITSTLFSNIATPKGVDYCDVYVFDKVNSLNAFLNKVDLKGLSFGATIEREENIKEGVFQIKNYLVGTYFIGIKNPSIFTPINVNIEVAAIVEESSISKETHDKAVTYGNLGWTAYEEGNVEKCITYSKKALELDNSLIYVKANLGLCYLIQNDETTATDYYVDALSDLKNEKTTKIQYINAIIKDIDDALLKNSNLKELLL